MSTEDVAAEGWGTTGKGRGREESSGGTGGEGRAFWECGHLASGSVLDCY